MERLLNFEEVFDCELFDKIVKLAFEADNTNKKEAENVLVKFKENPNSWSKVDIILKESKYVQSKFVGLQILEENIKSKWNLLDDSIKEGIREYVINYILSNSGSLKRDIILKKFNAILINIIKKEWPNKIPNFIPDLISTSQSASISVCWNSLEILKDINELFFSETTKMTTAKRRNLRNAIKHEYSKIFSFIQTILEYSEKNEVDKHLLVSCFSCFSSFCRTMEPQYIFSTKIIDLILRHLNTQYSTEVLKSLLEIIDLFEDTANIDLLESRILIIPEDIDKNSVYSKINLIHSEVMNFFKVYLKKFSSAEDVNNLSYDTQISKYDNGQNINSKIKPCLKTEYESFEESEKIFVQTIGKVLGSIYRNYSMVIPAEELNQSLFMFCEICKIDNLYNFQDLFFDTWRVLIYKFYSEYPLRPEPYSKLNRTRYKGVLKQMINVFVDFMPKPKEVFVEINELNEVIKVKKITTEEGEFSRKMSENLFYLSFCIEQELKEFFQIKINSVGSNINKFNPMLLNKLCWSFGSLANAFDEVTEKNLLINVLKSLLTLCTLVDSKEDKTIVASNIMFVIGQYHRFLKSNSDFYHVVIFKLVEFMGESHEGVKEMSVDTLYTICEKCPQGLFSKSNGRFIFEYLLEHIPSIHRMIGLSLQREIIEGLFIVLKTHKIKNPSYVKEILFNFTNSRMIFFNPEIFLTSGDAFSIERGVKATCHLFECYKLGFMILPKVTSSICDTQTLMAYYNEIVNYSTNNPGNNYVGIIINSLLSLFSEITNYFNSDIFLNSLIDSIIMQYKNTKNFKIIELAHFILKNSNEQSYVQRSILIISNIIVPSINLVSNGNNNPDVSIAYLNLLLSMMKDSSTDNNLSYDIKNGNKEIENDLLSINQNEEQGRHFSINFPLLMNNENFSSIISSILLNMGCMKEISDISLELIKTIFNECYKGRRQQKFFELFLMSAIENLLGILFDKDTQQNRNLQIELLYEIVNITKNIPSISPNGESNQTYIVTYLNKLFSSCFTNITSNSMQIFYEGLFGIKNPLLFAEHIKDFNVKIYEYGNDDDLDEEIGILKERMM